MTDREITQIWNEYYPKVFGYFYRRLNNQEDVEDLTSISLTSFLNKVSDPDVEINNHNAYLWRICHNQLNTLIRNKSKNPAVVPYDESWVPEDDTLENQRSKEFNDRMSSLKKCISKHCKDEDVTIIELSYFEQLSSDEIATKVAMKAATVRKRLSRAISKIREACNKLWFTYN
jgi:RNA polymerase sigma-70 factor (ECF subfamily)